MISERQKKFVCEYLKTRCKNGALAAVLAGYNEKTASLQADKLLKNARVAKYLNERKALIEKELREDILFDALEARRVLNELLISADAADRDRISVAKDLLDRAGFKPSNKPEPQEAFVVVIENDLEPD